jgi:Na+/H+-dicarboxylate symporter
VGALLVLGLVRALVGAAGMLALQQYLALLALLAMVAAYAGCIWALFFGPGIGAFLAYQREQREQSQPHS